MIGICTDVTQENLTSLLKQIEQVSSIMWPSDADSLEEAFEHPTEICECQKVKIKTLYYSEAWKGLLTYGCCADHVGDYEVVNNKEFVKRLGEYLPKNVQTYLEV